MAALERARHLATTARRGPGYDHDAVGFNYRMSNLQAAVGCAQLAQLPLFLAAKRRIAARYLSSFSSLEDVEPFPVAHWASSAHWLSGVYLPKLDATAMDAVRTGLRARGVDARPFWKPVHLQLPFADAPRRPTPVAERIWSGVLPLPCSTHLTVDEQDQVIDALTSVLAEIA